MRWMLGVLHEAILASVSATLRTTPMTVLAGSLEMFWRNA